MPSNTSHIKVQTGTTSLLRLPYNLIRPVYEKSAFHRSVIDELSDINLRDAYAHCRALTRHHAKTFYLSTRFLPNEKQRSIFSIYALCRYMDDLIDESFDLSNGQKILESDLDSVINTFKSKLDVTYESGVGDNPILTAFADTLKNYHIPKEYPLELLEGVCMDISKNRYDTFDELYTYSYKVASIVGLMTSEVFGYTNKDAQKHAIDLGIAMQLTNILRDIGEDLQKNRIYIPKEDLDRFNISEQDLFDKKLDDRFTSLMEFQIERARSFYESADQGIPMLNADSRLPVYLARHNYSRILDRIEDNKFQVFNQRAHLSTSEKLAIIPKAWLSAMM
jgi:phytoene synthase